MSDQLFTRAEVDERVECALEDLTNEVIFLLQNIDLTPEQRAKSSSLLRARKVARAESRAEAEAEHAAHDGDAHET